MITAIRQDYNNVYEFRGLSTDTKPTENVGNGSVFYCMDTGSIYLFDEENQQWKLQ